VASYDRLIVAGNLSRDPEIRYVDGGGKAVTKFSLASNRRTKQGDEVLFLDVVAWEQLADRCNQDLKKGTGALVEGRLAVRNYETSEGEKRDPRRRTYEPPRLSRTSMLRISARCRCQLDTEIGPRLRREKSLGQHAAHFCALAASNSTLESGHAYAEGASSANTLRISARCRCPLDTEIGATHKPREAGWAKTLLISAR
jgi:hypothetical protein